MQYSVPRLIVNVQAWRNVRNADGTFNLSARAQRLTDACAVARRSARARSLIWNFWKSPVVEVWDHLLRRPVFLFCLNAAILTNLDPWLVWLSRRQKLRLPGGEGARYIVSVEKWSEKRRNRGGDWESVGLRGWERAWNVMGRRRMGRNSNYVTLGSFLQLFDHIWIPSQLGNA